MTDTNVDNEFVINNDKDNPGLSSPNDDQCLKEDKQNTEEEDCDDSDLIDECSDDIPNCPVELKSELKEEAIINNIDIATDQNKVEHSDVKILSEVCPGIGRLYSKVEVECSVCYVKLICKRLTLQNNTKTNKETVLDKLIAKIALTYDAPMQSTCENVVNYCFQKDDKEVVLTLDGNKFVTRVYHNGSTVEYPYQLKPNHIKKIKKQIEI